MKTNKKLVGARCWIALTLLAAVVALGGSGGEGHAQGDGIIKMGFVRVEDVFVKFEGTNQAIEQFRDERRAAETELAELEERREAGTVSDSEFLVRQAELTTQLNILDAQLTAEITSQIVAAARQVGERFEFDWVTRLNNVVVHAQSRVVSDLTGAVLAVMNANFEGVPFDFDSISLSPKPLERIGFFSAEDVFVGYDGAAEPLAELRIQLGEVESRREQLNADREAGRISQFEFDQRQAELNAEQAALEQAFTDGVISEIVQAVDRLGDAADYNLISSQTNVVLHHNPRAVTDLTQSVLTFINAEFHGDPFDDDSVPLPLAAPRRIGFVNADRVFLEFEGTDQAVEKFRAQIEAAQAELNELQQDLDAGRVDAVTALARKAQLEDELNALDQQLTSEITSVIVDTARVLGDEQGDDLITPLANVVVYHNPDRIDDLTDTVLDRMNANN